jgi:iron complex transport system ATP-binding protein
LFKRRRGKTLLLEIAGVTVCRESTTILDRIDLTIPEGRHTAILGPNGSGKSSLLKLLLRYYYPSVEPDGFQGEVRILGRSDWEVTQLRRNMGIVTSQLDYDFCSGRTGRMTVTQAVASGFTATELPAFGVEMTPTVLQAVELALSRVGELHLASRRVATLSTGERRRVMIARALVHQPQVLVLDEPTSGLDLVAAHDFLQMIRQIVHGGQVTLVLVTHHVEEIIPEISHVVLLQGGKIRVDLAKELAMTVPHLEQVYGVPIELGRNDDGYYSAKLK